MFLDFFLCPNNIKCDDSIGRSDDSTSRSNFIHSLLYKLGRKQKLYDY